MNRHQFHQWAFNNLWFGENGTPNGRKQDFIVELVMPVTSRVWGGDFSHWNRPPVNFQRMKDVYNMRFAILKGCDGSVNSNYYPEHRAGIKAAGLPWGMYAWLYPASRVNIDAQVNAWFARYSQDVPPMGLFIDAEWTYYSGQPANPGAADLRAACDKWFAKSGKRATVYTAKGYADQYLKGFDWTHEPLWVAHYGVDNPALPSGATAYKIHQFTSTLDGKALDPNGNAELDGNYYNGTPEQFASEYGGDVLPPAPVSEYQTFRRFESDCHLVVTDPKKYHVYVTNTHGQFIKTSFIAEQFGAKYAINGDLYTINRPDSLACSDGDLYQPIQMEFNPFFNSTRTGALQFGHKATPDLYNTVSGSHYLVELGTVNTRLFDTTNPTNIARHPRTAVGVDAAGNIMLLVVEGRTESDSGTTLAETAHILVEFGCQTAINLDGGGSSTMVADGQIKNYVSDGVERAVINHLLLIPIGGTLMAKNKVTITWDAGARERERPRVSTSDTYGVTLLDNSVHYSDADPVPDMDDPTNPNKRWIQLQSGWFIATRYPSSSGVIERARVEPIIQPAVKTPFTLSVDGFKPFSGELEKL